MSSRKSSTESREFWEKTMQLLQELSILREDVAEISCPCHKPNCPFRHDSSGRRQRGPPTRRRSTLHAIDTRRVSLNSDRHSLGRNNVASYLASIQQQEQQRRRVAPQKAVQFRQDDCLVTEEPLAGLTMGEEYFIRSAPSRRGQRRHSCIRISNSYPTTMSSLAVPNFLDLRYERSWAGSLPGGMNYRFLGSSLDSLDSEKLQDVQKPLLIRQRVHQSSIELERW